MSKNSSFSLAKAQVQAWPKLIHFSGLLAINLFLPAIIHQQLVTGSIINAILFWAAITLGPNEAILLGLIPSTVAISRGLLPMAMAPMMPFIMLANALLVFVFSQLKTRQMPGFMAVSLASLAKAGLLSLVSFYLMPSLVPAPLASSLQAAMSWLQLITALLGGSIYLLVDSKLSPFKRNE